MTGEKMQNRAGATPLFRRLPPKKFRGVAPALRHDASCRIFSTVTQISDETQITSGETQCRSLRKHQK